MWTDTDLYRAKWFSNDTTLALTLEQPSWLHIGCTIDPLRNAGKIAVALRESGGVAAHDDYIKKSRRSVA